MFIVRTLSLITLIPVLSLNTVFSRPIMSSSVEIQQVPERFSAVAGEDEFLKLDVEAKEQRLQKQREALIAAKSETALVPEKKSVELPEPGIILKPILQKPEAAVEIDGSADEVSDAVVSIEELTAEIAAAEEDIKNLKLERLLLRLQQSDNPRIKASVGKYKEVIQEVNAFESEYFNVRTFDDYTSIVKNIDDFPAEDLEHMRKIYKQFEDALSNPETKELFFQTLYKTDDVVDRVRKVLKIVGVEDRKLSFNIRAGRYGGEYDTFAVAVVAEMFPDILKKFIRDLLFKDIGKGYIEPARRAFPFHSFTPKRWQGGVLNTPWKIHVSGVDFNAWYIFKYTLPYFWANERMFKVYESIFDLEYFYDIGSSINQAGKLLTIYPLDDKESKELAKDLNDLLMILGVKESHVVPVANDVKVGPAPGVYGRYEGHAPDTSLYERFVPWGDNLNADRNAECPFVQPGIDIKWEKDGEVLVPSWGDRPSTWYKVPSLKADFALDRGRRRSPFHTYLNDEGKALYASEHSDEGNDD